MSYHNIKTTCVTLLVTVMCSNNLVWSRVYHKLSDIEVKGELSSQERKGSFEFDNAPLWPIASFPHSTYWSSSVALSKALAHKPPVRTPTGTFLMDEENSVCLTPNGEVGICGPIRSCYPFDTFQEPNVPESRMLPSRATCRYVNLRGISLHGVCCPKVTFPTVESNEGLDPTPSFPMGASLLWLNSLMPFFLSNIDNPSSSGDWVWGVAQFPLYLGSSLHATYVASSSSVGSITPNWWIPVDSATATAVSSTSSSAGISEDSTSVILPIDATATAVVQTTPMPISVHFPGHRSGCGTGPYKMATVDHDQQRIVGGYTATKNAWPFAVSLVAKGIHFCGGSLLDTQHVLTAAHCVAQMTSAELSQLDIILGLHTRQPMDAEAVHRKPRRVIRHKEYVASTFYNDLAIIRLDAPVQFSNSISPICLPSSGTKDLYVGKDAVVVGWGALREEDKSLPSSLQQVTVKIQTNDDCKKSYGKDAPGGILDNMLCAANPQKDSCMGDSGGPLVMQTSPGSPWIQIGVVSWGIGCGRSAYPGVYVRLTSFLDWINKHTKV